MAEEKRKSTAGRKRVTFEVAAAPGQKVFLAGTFNNWSADGRPMQEAGGTGSYRTTMMLPRGRHEYKFVIDGVWCVDPDCPDWAPNDHGTLNSVIIVD